MRWKTQYTISKTKLSILSEQIGEKNSWGDQHLRQIMQTDSKSRVPQPTYKKLTKGNSLPCSVRVRRSRSIKTTSSQHDRINKQEPRSTDLDAKLGIFLWKTICSFNTLKTSSEHGTWRTICQCLWSQMKQVWGVQHHQWVKGDIKKNMWKRCRIVCNAKPHWKWRHETTILGEAHDWSLPTSAKHVSNRNKTETQTWRENSLLKQKRGL